MDSIDADAELIGIDKKVWMEFRGMHTSWKDERETQYKERELPSIRELPLERELPPPRMEQSEFESITNPIDDREAFIRHKQALAKRAFAWYRLSKKKDKSKLINIYNEICLLKKERD